MYVFIVIPSLFISSRKRFTCSGPDDGSNKDMHAIYNNNQKNKFYSHLTNRKGHEYLCAKIVHVNNLCS